MTPTFGSLFAGVGGFDLGFESAGYECRFQVEWDKNCQQTLAYHWPDVPRWGDVSDVNGANLPPVDVITYGFPCQDLSVAGLRAGLDGDRSNLFFQAVRIIKEMRAATNGRYPTFAVAENVPGLLNADGGSAMARVLDALAEAGAMVIEWCVLDAQWFGVPQRRRRVFVAACFDSGVAGRCPDPLFPVAKSGSRNPPPCNQERETVAGPTSDSVGTDGIQRVTGTLAAGAHPGSYNGQDAYNDMLIPFVKARRAQNPDDYETWIADAPNPTLNEFDGGDKRTTTAIVQPDLAVRRLTPLECERLQGFPDNHTLHRADGKTNSDSSRYKQCGNGVAAPVAKWIAEKLKDTL
jgi:DNA (cytosine-5)-methyltransferase 1